MPSQYVNVSLLLVIMTTRPEHLFESQKVELQVDLFQKYPHQDGLSLHNTENDYEKLYDNNSDNAFTMKNFYCVFCKDISSFRIDEIYEYENHLNIIHTVSYDHDILKLVNFIDKEKKSNVIYQAKKFVRRGNSFECKLCKEDTAFTIGNIKQIKEHLNSFHNIFYEIGFVLAINLVNKSFKELLLRSSNQYIYNIKQDNRLNKPKNLESELHADSELPNLNDNKEKQYHENIPPKIQTFVKKKHICKMLKKLNLC